MVEIHQKFKPFFQPKRYKVAYGGRAGIKSWTFARILLLKAAEKPLRILCTREVQLSIKDSVHKLLSDQIQLLGLGSFYEVEQSKLRGKNGSEFIFAGLSTETAESIKSFEGIDICWVEEANAVSEFSWKILIPTIRKQGSEIWVSFNPSLEHDPAYQRFVANPPSDSIVIKTTYQDNLWLSDTMKAEIAEAKTRDYQEYLHIWEGELKSIADGAVYGPQIVAAKKENRILELPIEPSVTVDTFWDLGMNDHTAIWFMQNVGPHYRFIDYHENRQQGLDYYARILKGREPTQDETSNERRFKYIYGNHYLPHDVEATILGMPKTRRQQLVDLGINPILTVPRVSGLSEGIEAVRRMFPSCWFHAKNCEDGIKALSNYHWKVDPDKNTNSRQPVHDWSSHGSDAFRQFAQGYRGAVSKKMAPIKYPEVHWV